MKRIISLIALLTICFSLCACTSGAPKTETIQLTATNFSDYFYLECETTSYESHVVEVLGYAFETGYADCQISISKKKPCEPSDVILTLDVYSTGISWDEKPKTVTVKVSVDGNTTKKVSFESEETVKGLVSEPRFYTIIKEVSGTVKVEVD